MTVRPDSRQHPFRVSLPRSVAVVGPAPPDLAWQRYAQLAVWPRWAPAIRSVSSDGGLLRPGLTGVVHGPAAVRLPFEVLEVDEPARSWRWRVRVGPASVVMLHEVIGRPAGGSVATLVIDGPPALAAGYLPVARIALGRLLRTPDRWRRTGADQRLRPAIGRARRPPGNIG